RSGGTPGAAAAAGATPTPGGPPAAADASATEGGGLPPAGPTLRAGGAGAPPLAREIDRILPRWRGARWGVLVVSLERGDTLYARAPDLALAPASNLKLVTTAAALHHLGPDYRYRTFLLADGPVRDGTLHGDLILYGTGDPGIGDRFQRTKTAAFEALADSLVAQGIHTVTGDLVGDGTYFAGPDRAPGWRSEDLNDWFAAPVSALSFNENVVTVRVVPAAAPGRSPAVELIPDAAVLDIENVARTVTRRPRPNLWLDRTAPEAPVHIDGEMRVGGRDAWRQLTIPDGPLYAASALRSVLEARGIEVRGATRALEADDDAASRVTGRRAWDGLDEPRVLAVHISPPLLDYLRVVNHESHNFFAEAVFKTVGRVVEGDGSFAGGARVVRRFLRDRVGVGEDGLRVLDGSGLSEANRATAGGLVQLITWVEHSPLAGAFEETLPVAGRRRGLRRMYRTRAAGNLRAKTGTIDGVSALSGIVRSADGERLAFAILVNGVRSTSAAKGVEDRIGVALARFRRSP
ncbi:MAG: D-alanyl-D-alanine carboxypeptidase/D-alanyl-D-alanine-endopeptidase, partial [Gemmatimonadetes bacterium]